MTAEDVEQRVAHARVARLATIGPSGAPDLVPITFVYAGGVVYSVVDHKRKVSRDLRRLANIRRDPRVTVLVDHYDDDWTRLWWCRLRGEASVVESGTEFDDGVLRLSEKYEQYRETPPAGPMIVIRVTDRRTWSARG